ncbi:MAG: plasmid pRiA4b ORF-3 family protein [Treponema sp.]|jgi:hypothetical protein|nr:plasmid pRiA4b ORF-3 family protein [Treponema sp.]
MTISQEDALYDFLENVTEPFSLDDIAAFIRMVEPKRHGRLSTEITSFIDTRRIAFPLDGKRWLSRRGCFESLRFVICPSRLELLNGILIPGHRCIPFANPVLLPQEYSFRWRGQTIALTTTEGPPEDFYPYYSLFGEEYAPQYVARDNPGNEEAFNSDLYEDPGEVSIHTPDMRNIYREASFVPGDLFVVSTLDWKKGIFELEKADKTNFSEKELDTWLEAAKDGFTRSFEYLGAGASTEEQIAFAYWFGGERMRSLPAHTLEEFLGEKTDHIEVVPYGIETRFWYAGKDIPDRRDLEGVRSLPDRTVIEEILYRLGVPISEYVVQSFVRDALYQDDCNEGRIIERIIPCSAGLGSRDREYLADYILEVLKEFSATYSRFSDSKMAPIRTRVGELHTAVIELAIQLQKNSDVSWLPKHTFVVLSQIQGHAASILEDLDTDEALAHSELDAMDNSVDSMLDTYEDLKELIREATESFRKNNISLYTGNSGYSWRTVQISLGGTDIWRRMALPENFTLEQLRVLIQCLFGWSDDEGSFSADTPGSQDTFLKPDLTIGDLSSNKTGEFLCEFGTKWTVKIIILSRYQPGPEEGIRCLAGAGAAPPRFIDGPLRFRRFISALELGSDREQRLVMSELGREYDPESFDIDSCNRALKNAPLPFRGPAAGSGAGHEES